MSSPSDHDEAAPGIAGYRFVRHLGSGGYSQVYLYEQQMPRRNVAVKVLNTTGLTKESRRQFTAEANAMAGLADHPNIVQVLDAAIADDGRPYLVMQYCPHPNLSVRARREHFSVAEVLRIGIQIGSAVETAHRNDILHRDIKPHNVLTAQYGAPALADFGIAAKKGADNGPDAGVSVPWSPPEVLYGTADGDERADVYSLAATLWHLLVGHSPFEQPKGDNSTLALMERIRSDPPPPTRRGDVPDSLERLLRQTLAKDPAARPQTALDFVRALQAIEQEQRLPLTQIVIAAERPGVQDSAAASDDDVTRVRGPRLIDPQPSPADPDATRVRGAALINPAPPARSASPQPGVPPRRSRQLPGAPAPAVTSARPVVAAPDPAADPQAEGDGSTARPRARLWSVRNIAVAVVAVLVIAVALVLAVPHHGTGHAASGKAKSRNTGTSAIGPAVSAPGTPSVAVSRASAGKLRFTWTYANHARGDVFRWRRVSGGTGAAAGTATKPVVLLAAPGGKSVCITVQVVRADGSQASTPSAPACGS